MSIFSSLTSLFGGAKSTSPEYIKGKDGKFLGRKPGAGSIPSVASGRHNGTKLTSPNKMPSYWDAEPVSGSGTKEQFQSAFDTLMNLDKASFTKEFQAEMSLRNTSAKYAESNEGQLEVLTKAKELIDLGQIEKANILIDAAQAGREKAASLADPNDAWVVEKMIRQTKRDHFDYIDDAITDFVAGTKEKVMVPPVGNDPAKELPYNAIAVAKALSNIAGTVSSAAYMNDSADRVERASVFSPELIAEAKKYEGINYISPDPKDNTYVHPDYYNFIRKVTEAQKENKELLRYRVERAIRWTESVIYHKSKDSVSLW